MPTRPGASETRSDRAGSEQSGGDPTGSGDGGLFRATGVVLVACGLSAWFFPVLWLGGGLVGGDLYPYFMPQRTAYADALAEGRIPLWNHLVGHGYPQLAESQTGVFYPPNLVAYWLLDVNAAYVTIQLGHYVLAFCGVVAAARALRLSWIGGLLAGLVYVYGWFPPRICLEWAILGGAWLPWSMVAMLRWHATGYWRFAFLLAGCWWMQLLAGHFVIAFITQLLVFAWSGLLVLNDWRRTKTVPREFVPGEFVTGIGLAFVLAFLGAGVQLVPTWEYKQLSQRQSAGIDFDPLYGAIPWPYLAQIVLPWTHYNDPSDLNDMLGGRGSLTNRVEAHLYFGLVPLGLVTICSLIRLIGRRGDPPTDRHASHEVDRLWWPLLVLALLATVHATGVLGAFTRHLPGFGFFTGPGRFGLMTTFVMAILSARTWDRLAERIETIRIVGVRGAGSWLATVAGLAAVAITTADFAWVAERVGYAAQVLTAPIEYRSQSPLRAVLLSQTEPVRLFCRGANVATILGVASTPTYLGLSPAAYSDPALRMPEPLPFDVPPTVEQIDWLRRAGVTHVLSFTPLDRSAWPVRDLGVYDDPMLNRVWGRYGGPERPLFYLYALEATRGRVAWEEPQAGDTARVVAHRGDAVIIEATSRSGGRLILMELAYPGWTVTVDGQRATSETFERMYRAVKLAAGTHRVEWRYEPVSFRVGVATSLAAMLFAAALGHVRYWHPRWTDWRWREVKRKKEQLKSDPA